MKSFIPKGITWAWYALAAMIVGMDQWSKHAIEKTLAFNEPLVFTSFFNFTKLYNEGAAFSFLSNAGGWQRWFFTIIALVVCLGIVAWLARLGAKKRWEAVALACILGGALGNLIDRMLLGHVVDFIVFHYQQWAWPAFNIADIAISVGAVLLIIDALFIKSSDKSEDSEAT